MTIIDLQTMHKVYKVKEVVQHSCVKLTLKSHEDP